MKITSDGVITFLLCAWLPVAAACSTTSSADQSSAAGNLGEVNANGDAISPVDHGAVCTDPQSGITLAEYECLETTLTEYLEFSQGCDPDWQDCGPIRRVSVQQCTVDGLLTVYDQNDSPLVGPGGPCTKTLEYEDSTTTDVY